jgi:hypothetical protein
MLPDTPDVELVIVGKDGVAEGRVRVAHNRHEHDLAYGPRKMAESARAAA